MLHQALAKTPAINVRFMISYPYDLDLTITISEFCIEQNQLPELAGIAHPPHLLRLLS